MLVNGFAGIARLRVFTQTRRKALPILNSRVRDGKTYSLSQYKRENRCPRVVQQRLPLCPQN